MEDDAIQAESLAGPDEAFAADQDGREVFQAEEVQLRRRGRDVQQKGIRQGEAGSTTAAARPRSVDGEAIGMESSGGQNLQFEQLGRMALARAEVHPAAFETLDALCLKCIEGLSSDQQPPGIRRDERSKVAMELALECSQRCTWLQEGAGWKERPDQFTQSFELLDGFGAGCLEVGQGRHGR